MKKTLAQQLADKGLVDPFRAKMADDAHVKRLAGDEHFTTAMARGRASDDAEAVENDRRFHISAAKEGRQATSNAGSKAYLARFKK